MVELTLWILTVLIPINGFLYLGARWERERTARIVRTIREHTWQRRTGRSF